MKAPEKIYLQKNTTTDCYEEFWPEWFEARAKDTDIEYIRTDIFIEKVADWIRSNYLKYPNEDCSDTIMFINDLIKHMKIVTVCG